MRRLVPPRPFLIFAFCALVAIALAHWSRPERERIATMGDWPPIPEEVQALGGPIAVKLVVNPKDEDGNELWGSWEQHIRTIEIDAGAPIEFQWHTLQHELCHAALGDSGAINLLDADEQETVCDALASARVQEMRGP